MEAKNSTSSKSLASELPKGRGGVPSLEKETRFAVVMYGGVSLAIYIYGVAKELYKMVRATARKPADEDQYQLEWYELDSTEKIYRRLGESLRTKFVVDILSGTSAGGINAIYLAKALANGQSFDSLKDIWIEQGDISKLINDRKSKVTGLEIQTPPASLLNSEHMYYHLFKALDGMDTGPQVSTPGGVSPFVEELDLSITATDIRGLRVHLPITNAAAHEFKFRNVFRFHYSTMDAAGWGQEKKQTDVDQTYSNDFKKNNNPFLAYVARCTSSFPFAFEPMRLDDIRNVLKVEEFEGYKYAPTMWSNFFSEYEKAGDDFPQRSFGDGGYLDNKPFSYATEALLRRRADRLVDRKLIYIDPSPEHPQDMNTREKPDAIQNVMAAVLSIPRYEPIREDLEKVVDRNQLIQRVNNIISRFKHVPRIARDVKTWQNDARLWTEKYFDPDLLAWFGSSYATYHQLRVASVLEGLTSAILRAFNWSENGKEADDLGVLLEGWRRSYYTTDPKYKKTHWSENDILYRFDTLWRMRRIQYLQGIIDQLLEAVYALAEDSSYSDQEREKLVSQANKVVELSGVKFDISELDNAKTMTELKHIKREINDAYGYLRARGRKLRSQSLLKYPQSDEQLQLYIDQLLDLKKHLEDGQLSDLAQKGREFLSESSASETEGSGVTVVFEKIEHLLGSLAVHLDEKTGRGYIRDSLSLAGNKVRSAIGSAPQKGQRDARSEIQKCLHHYFDQFEYYDMLVFPVYYGTGVDESDEVEIIRISPEDATNLFDEKKVGRKKLAGTAVANFGAFFAREWRENDMMWGRLDGAECLIKALRVEGDERAELIEEIHQSILQEELTPRDENKVFQAKNDVERAAIGKYKARFGLQDDQAERLYKAIHRLSEPEKLTENFRNGYSIDREFPPGDTLLAGSRALRVLGNLLNGLSGSYKSIGSPAKWLTGLGSIFAGILAIALPNSIGNFLVDGYWVWLLYLFEILLGIFGWLFGAKDVQQIGILSFGLTAAAHLCLNVLSRWLSRRINLKLLRALISFVVFLLLAGIIFLIYIGFMDLGVIKMPEGVIGQWLLQITAH